MRTPGHLKTSVALLASAFALTVACVDHSDYDSPEELAIIEFDYSEPVHPVLTVPIPDNDEAQNLFADGVAQFAAEQEFQQVSWMMDADDVSDLQVRALNSDGGWSDWAPVEITWNEGDAYNVLIRLEEPTRAIELRGGEAILAAELEFYEEIIARSEFIGPDSDFSHPEDIAPPESDEFRTARSALAPASMVTSRSEWGATNPGKICGSVVAPYRMAIHHTAVPDGDGGDPAARMRGMQSYHMNTLGWCDIGYHFVVAQSGEIFQGRSRSNRPGAHVGGNNSGNVGISFIANFSVQHPTETQLNAGADIVRWVHETHGVPLTRDAVKGHREHAGHASNSCPGSNMIPMIEELLDRAANGSTSPSTEPSSPSSPSDGDSGGSSDDGGSSNDDGGSNGGATNPGSNFQSNNGCTAVANDGPAGPLPLAALVLLGLVGVRRLR